MRDDGNVRLGVNLCRSPRSVPSKIKSTGTFRLEPAFGPNKVSNIRWRYLGESGP